MNNFIFFQQPPLGVGGLLKKEFMMLLAAVAQ